MPKSRVPLAIAAILALASGVIAYSAVQAEFRRVRKGFVPIPVVVAAVDLAEGTVITMEMISSRPMPEQFVTASVVKPENASFILGQRIMVPLQAGDPLLWSQFETTRAAERLSSRIQQRTRAITIATKGVSAVGGWVRPNDHVDVVGTFKSPDTGDQNSLTLLQNVIVLATGRITGQTNVNLLPEAQRDYANVSLLVVPEEAEVLTLAQDLGELTLTLRNDEDVSALESRAYTGVRTLFDGDRLTRMRILREKVAVIRGTNERHEVVGERRE